MIPRGTPTANWTNVSARIGACMADIGGWMSRNLLKLNEDKFEFMIFHQKQCPLQPLDLSLTLSNSTFLPGNPGWTKPMPSCVPQYLTKRLQNTAARLITRTLRRDPSAQISTLASSGIKTEIQDYLACIQGPPRALTTLHPGYGEVLPSSKNS